jgi:ferredoxin hydrogenase large subunit/hydrogenase large subunit
MKRKKKAAREGTPEMAAIGLKLSRVEGGMYLVQEDAGVIRLVVHPPRNFERKLAGRLPQDALFLTQQISADSAVSHALAAVMAWEQAAEVPVAPNGLIARDLLHTLSLLHANLRHFYFQALPDYLPPSAFAGYQGAHPELRAIAASLKDKDAGTWARFRFSHPFTSREVAVLSENQLRAAKALSLLQRMLAMLGGKFPMVMSIAPGGVTLQLSEHLIIRLRTLLEQIAAFLRAAPLQDGLLLVQKHEQVRLLGKGEEAMISAGTIGDDTGPAASLFPKGVWMARTLEPFQPRIRENIRSAFYRISGGSNGQNGVLEFAPEKEGAYSWIKAPRYLDRAMETGPLARLLITHLGGSRTHTVDIVREMEGVLRLSLSQANTVGGRLLARLGELAPLVERCEALLAQFTPEQPSIQPPGDLSSLSGEGIGRIEAPAGFVQHRLVLDKGKVAHADIISPSTWNGAPGDATGKASGLELALNEASPNLRTQSGQLKAARIVHSYFFSATDAVQ